MNPARPLEAPHRHRSARGMISRRRLPAIRRPTIGFVMRPQALQPASYSRSSSQPKGHPHGRCRSYRSRQRTAFPYVDFRSRQRGPGVGLAAATPARRKARSRKLADEGGYQRRCSQACQRARVARRFCVVRAPGFALPESAAGQGASVFDLASPLLNAARCTLTWHRRCLPALSGPSAIRAWLRRTRELLGWDWVAIAVRSSTTIPPPVSPETPMVMVCAGTGLRRPCFLQSARCRRHRYRGRPGLLLLRCDHPDFDLLYRDELADGRLPAWSACGPAFFKQPTAIGCSSASRSEGPRRRRASPQRHVYVCGDGKRLAPAGATPCRGSTMRGSALPAGRRSGVDRSIARPAATCTRGSPETLQGAVAAPCHEEFSSSLRPGASADGASRALPMAGLTAPPAHRLGQPIATATPRRNARRSEMVRPTSRSASGPFGLQAALRRRRRRCGCRSRSRHLCGHGAIDAPGPGFACCSVPLTSPCIGHGRWCRSHRWRSCCRA